MKKTLVAIALLSCAYLSVYVLDRHVSNATRNKLYRSVKKIPYNRVGLLLGTIKTLPNGRINLYYIYRIHAASKLYHSHKIDYILVSGDNSRKTYDEPTTIKKDLQAKGIPENRIYLDYAGFRTLDSVVRAQKVFGQNKFTVISQRFHNERAVFLASRNNIQAIGFNAKDVTVFYGLKTKIRERFARVKMFLDILFGIRPKFLGKKITIE
ncbi:MAG: ElyC/SanA/YdcF family protein [Spirochaetota bacterium]